MQLLIVQDKRQKHAHPTICHLAFLGELLSLVSLEFQETWLAPTGSVSGSRRAPDLRHPQLVHRVGEDDRFTVLPCKTRNRKTSFQPNTSSAGSKLVDGGPLLALAGFF